MPLADPWLSERMHEYARIRRAENEIHPAVRAAVQDYLAQAFRALLGGTTAAAFADDDGPDPDPDNLPDDTAWHAAVTRHIAPAVRRVWQASFGRLTRRQPPDDDQGHTDGTPGRLSGFRAHVADRLRRALRLGRDKGETPAQLRARVAALMTLENWDGQVMTMTRTETMAALNAGAYAGAYDEQERTGQPWEKRWQSTHDQRVRHTHHAADGQIRPLHEPFHVGETRLQFPGDPKGTPGEVINCRCAARYAPAGDPVLTAASTPQEEEPPMAPTATATPPGAVSVAPDGRWRGALGFIDRWSADGRMLAAPPDGVRVRPLPLPLAVQSTLADGHDGGAVGLGVIDRVWVEGETVMGEGRFDMADPTAAQIARKVGLGFLRFVSLDVDDATLKHVCVGDGGEVVEKCNPQTPDDIGRLYTDWRVMGATVVAHPAFPEAFIALADSSGSSLTAAAYAAAIGYDPEWGCVRPEGDGWQPADCDAPGAVPANPAGDGPYEPTADDTPAPPQDTLDEVPAEPPREDDDEDMEGDPEDLPEDTVEDDGNGCVAPDPEQDGAWVPADCGTEGAVPANAAGDGPADAVTDAANAATQLGQGGTDDQLANGGTDERLSAQHHDTLTTHPPADCTNCGPVTVTAAATDNPTPGWTPPADWFQPPGASAAHPIRIDPETGRVTGYLAAWGTCHVGYRDRCVTPPRSATDYSYFNIRPVTTHTGTVHCGLLTMDTGHAALAATAPAALAHYDNTGTQAAVVRVGEDNHGIWAAGAVLPFITPEQRLRLSLASFSGDWRSIRGSMELIAALAVNTPGFPLAAARTGADNSAYALVAAGALPPDTEPDTEPPGTVLTAGPLIDTAALADEVARRVEARQALRARYASLHGHLGQFRADTEQRAARDRARRAELARGRVVRVQRPKATETPLELAGLGTLPRPSNQDIALAKNWVDEQGGLPPYIKRIADHLKAKGMDTSRAIATAVNVAKKMCSTGDTNWPGVQQVNAKSKGEACAAVARWNAMKAAARAS